MDGFLLAGQALGGDVTQEVVHRVRAALQLGFRSLADTGAQADNFVVVRHLASQGTHIGFLTGSLQPRVEEEGTASRLQPPAVVLYQAALTPAT